MCQLPLPTPHPPSAILQLFCFLKPCSNHSGHQYSCKDVKPPRSTNCTWPRDPSGCMDYVLRHNDACRRNTRFAPLPKITPELNSRTKIELRTFDCGLEYFSGDNDSLVISREISLNILCYSSCVGLSCKTCAAHSALCNTPCWK